MISRTLLLLAVAMTIFAKEPRPLAAVPIPTPRGPKINLSQYRGKVVVAMIFSTHCDHCIKSVDLLSKVQKDLGPKGFQAVGAAGDENAQYLLGPFVERYKPTFPIGYLTKDEIIKLADLPPGKRPVVPILLFIDKKGVVRFQYFGDDPFFKTEDGSTRSIVENLLKE
jgi:thiol-disulfide isomerase/thioredoxin